MTRTNKEIYFNKELFDEGIERIKRCFARGISGEEGMPEIMGEELIKLLEDSYEAGYRKGKETK